MFTIIVRDFQYRWRQFAIALVGVMLLFSFTLILTGISEGFNTEANRRVTSIGADLWLVSPGITGPFTSRSAVPTKLVGRISKLAGVRRARPAVLFTDLIIIPGKGRKQINVLGDSIGHLGDPQWNSPQSDGRVTQQTEGQAVVDDHIGLTKGDYLTIHNHQFRVTGVVKNRTSLGGTPTVFLNFNDAQKILYGNQPLATAILIKGSLHRQSVGKQLQVMTPSEIKTDLLTPISNARAIINVLRILMLIVAALIIAAVIYLSTVERTRDFAVLKAIGGKSLPLGSSVAIQSVLTAAFAVVLGMIIAYLIRPLFPVPVTINIDAVIVLSIVAILIGTLASVAALQRVLRVDPAEAFGG